jgi:hypothetical protein
MTLDTRPSVIGLVNSLLDTDRKEFEDINFDVPSVQLKQDRADRLHIEYKGAITIAVVGRGDDREFVVSGSDCSRCDGSHVDCEHVEQLTKDYTEVCEMAEDMYQTYYR